MTMEQRVELWNAINAYAEACGGDTSARTVSTRRMSAVADVERILSGLGVKMPEAVFR